MDILYSEGIFIEVGKTVRNSWCPVLHAKGLQNDVDSILFREEFEEKRGRDLNTFDLTKKILDLFNSRCPGCKMVLDKDENGRSKTECFCYGY